MLSLNRAMVLGNITRDPEVRTTPSGQAVATFSIATNRRWTTQEGQQQEATEYHDVVAWGKLAEISQQFLKKGNRVYVDGRLQTRSWEGQDGNKRTRTEIVAENLISLERAPFNPDRASQFDTRVSTSIPTPPADEEAKAPAATKAEKKVEKKDEAASAGAAGAEDEISLDDIPF